MAKISEVDALKAIDEALAGLDDQQTKDRVLKWAWDKYSKASQSHFQPEGREGAEATKVWKEQTCRQTSQGSREVQGKYSFIGEES